MQQKAKQAHLVSTLLFGRHISVNKACIVLIYLIEQPEAHILVRFFLGFLLLFFLLLF